MSVAISKKFPTDLNDTEINLAIKGMSDEILNSGANINSVMQFSPLIQMGQNELQSRVLQKSANESSRTERIALGIAIFSVIISLTLYWLSSLSDNKWKDQELSILQKIEANTHK